VSAEPDVQFQLVPDPADVTFDGSGTPILTFEESHAGGPGWVLYCPDETDRAESYYLGGELQDLDWAEEAATVKLTMLEDDSGAY
jgi:hypothetical protein